MPPDEDRTDERRPAFVRRQHRHRRHRGDRVLQGVRTQRVAPRRGSRRPGPSWRRGRARGSRRHGDLQLRHQPRDRDRPEPRDGGADLLQPHPLRGWGRMCNDPAGGDGGPVRRGRRGGLLPGVQRAVGQQVRGRGAEPAASPQRGDGQLRLVRTVRVADPGAVGGHGRAALPPRHGCDLRGPGPGGGGRSQARGHQSQGVVLREADHPRGAPGVAVDRRTPAPPRLLPGDRRRPGPGGHLAGTGPGPPRHPGGDRGGRPGCRPRTGDDDLLLLRRSLRTRRDGIGRPPVVADVGPVAGRHPDRGPLRPLHALCPVPARGVGLLWQGRGQGLREGRQHRTGWGTPHQHPRGAAGRGLPPRDERYCRGRPPGAGKLRQPGTRCAPRAGHRRDRRADQRPHPRSGPLTAEESTDSGGSRPPAAGHRQAARDIVATMTAEEKLWCLDGDAPLWAGLTYLGEAGYHKSPFRASRVDRLGLPGFAFSDGPRGVVVDQATCFPVSMARGATWDVDLEERIGEAIGRELRAVGADLFGGVCVNVLRHPAWGRAQETYGEDPHHVGEMGSALARGVQRHAMACVKHLACNSMENARFEVDITVDEVALHEVYLPHFRRIVDEGIAVVMSAYNSVDGEWCGESRALLTDVLRSEWGFDGFVISDWIFGTRDAARSLHAGLGDGGSSDVWAPDVVTVADGLRAALPEVRVDVADGSDLDEAVSMAASAGVAVVVVGYTRLDEGEFIGDTGTTDLIGLFPGEDDPALVGRFTEEIAAGRSIEPPAHVGPRAEGGGFAVGGDRRSLHLHDVDIALIRAAAAANPRTVVALVAGSAVVISEWDDAVPAVVQSWYSGMEGGHGLADVLLGRVDATGRLPFSVPRNEADLPEFAPEADAFVYDAWHGYWHLARHGVAPAYPFGFGLSYTSFTLEKAEAALAGGELRVTVTVRNAGRRPGTDVVQVYASRRGSSRPSRLVGFARIELAAGRTAASSMRAKPTSRD